MSGDIAEIRLNVRVKGAMAEYVEKVLDSNSLYENQSEYVRDLIRHDMEKNGDAALAASIQRSLDDIEHGRYSKWDSKTSLEEAKAYAKERNKK